MRPAALALSLLLLLPLPAGAQEATLEGAPGEREVVVTAFRAMVDRGEIDRKSVV